MPIPESYPNLARLLLLLSLLLAGCDSGGQDGQIPEQPGSQTAAPGEPDRPAAARPAGSTTGAPSAEQLAIQLSEAGVTITARAVDQRTILHELAARAGFAVTEAGVPWQAVTLDIEAKDLHGALAALLQEYPYRVIYEHEPGREADTLSRVVVGDPARLPVPAPQTPAAAAAPALPDYQAIPPATRETLSEEDQVNLTLMLDPSPEVREKAVDEIEPVGIALDYLTQIVTSDPSSQVRMAAVWTLEDSEDPKAYDALIRALQDQDPEVLEEVIDSLGYLGNKAAVPYLQPFLDHPDEDVRDAAEDALYQLE